MIKKIPTLFLLLSALVFLSSCDDIFNPKGEYDERYALNCIIRSDTMFQVATAYKSYNVSGIDPYENTTDSFIDGVFLRMWNGDDLYVFRDSTMERPPGSRYDTPIKYYYIDEYIPSPGDKLEIEALLPNGRRLRSFTTIPSEVRKNFQNCDNTIPSDDKNFIRVEWIPNEVGQVFMPTMNIFYYKLENGQKIRHLKIVPWELVLQNGVEKEIQPYPSKASYVDFKMELIDRAMKEISGDDPAKENYIILTAIIDLLVFDRNLSGYYSSVASVSDEFSIRLDEIDFSNIDGGFGVFGSYFKQKFVLFFDKLYIESFGYIDGIDNYAN